MFLQILPAPADKTGGITPTNSKFLHLNRFLDNIQAESIPVDGRLSTWKKRLHTHLIYERLDRSIARRDWLDIYPQAFETHGSFTCSDHSPIILSTSADCERRKMPPFRFHNAWCNYQHIRTIVHKQWCALNVGTRMFCLYQKLKHVKQDIKDWKRIHFGNFRDKILTNEQKIAYVEERLLTCPTSY